MRPRPTARTPGPGRAASRHRSPVAPLLLALAVLVQAAAAACGTAHAADPADPDPGREAAAARDGDDAAAEGLGPPRHVLLVADAGELRDALARAEAGDHVVLRDGVYEGDLELTRGFPAPGRLVVRAERTLGARATGRWRVAGDGLVLRGIAWEGPGAGVDVSGSRVRLTRCAVRDVDTGDPLTTPRAAVAIGNRDGETTRAVAVDHCEVSGYGVNGVVVSPDGVVEDVAIERNHIHHGALTGGGRNQGGSAIYLGLENRHRERSVRARVAWNLVEDHRAGHTIHVKSSGNLIAFNTLRKPEGAPVAISVRHGRDNRVVGNVVERGRISTFDYGTRILGNRAREIWLQAGNRATGYSYDGLPSKREAGYSTRPASRGARVAGNAGTLVVGQHYDSYCSQEPTPVEGAAVYRHAGEVRLVEGGCAPWYRDVAVEAGRDPPADWGPVPGPEELSEGQVGPFSGEEG